MPSLYPMSSSPEDFLIGDRVRKFVSEISVSPYIGVVTHLSPSTYKVWVQWPDGNEAQEDPDTLIRVNPALGLPTVHCDKGYDSYEKQLSEKFYGPVQKAVLATNKMAIRVAYSFANNVIGKLVDDAANLFDEGLSDVQAYNRLYTKYGSVCSDHMIKSSIQKIFGEV